MREYCGDDLRLLDARDDHQLATAAGTTLDRDSKQELAELLLHLKRPAEPLIEFFNALALAPGRRGELSGLLDAATEASVGC